MSYLSGSTSSRPDLDWSQLKETIVMLNLAVTQIDQSMNEGNSSVSTLSTSFTGLATNLSDIQSSISQLHQENDSSTKMKLIIEGSTSTALDKVHSAIIAFQFYDKLSQRLDHVSESLSSLTTLISNPEELYSPIAWQALQETIRSKYTMEEERRMFDRVVSGVPIEEALIEFKQDMANKSSCETEEIELF
ncbi:hypothetical protein [Colwellia psychrerythraea]|uniref:Chemotaxis protein n=1 Tax=Colwellia psychrerythraea TaxID=28229 RepID=A0A099KX74_COLPS|nr:hypothetical protein [Colwellia psychrerythraea]KGJ95171.1 hypothetical protein GAB14E_1953 [Colwellia psychrerythraea]